MSRWTEIADPGVRALMAAYFAKVERALAPLPRAEAEEIKSELETHAIEALAASGGGEARAHEVLAQLGDPQEFLPALVAGRLRARAGRTFSPADVAAALARNSASGLAGVLVSTLAGLGYAIAALCVALGVFKMFAPRGTGVYRLETGELFIGVDENVRGVDLFGMWFSPLSIAVGVGLYVLLTWAFGRIAVRKRAPSGREAMEH